MKGNAPPLFTPENQTSLVKGIFSTIAEQYDFLNHFLSFGQDIVWRRRTVQNMKFTKTGRCLDVATGTGDIALAVAKKYPDVIITGIDFSAAMIEIAKKKAVNIKRANNITFQWGDATQIEFPDDSFDVAVIAFGIRNIPDKAKTLREMARVVVPGGQVMVLEMVSQQNRFFKKVYQTYLCYGLPFLAGLFSSNKKAYHYLSNSIIRFPSTAEFCQLMEQSGLKVEKTISMTFGITRLFIGIKL
ncbi:bifunctional demethylmenaquinone methyltransferase/2-methoxy-6-polyprenyl-1,4-benzoquinol methylase UbiE [bacterium]|nr:bifunctional demethylmenaquinone methyltransferase/2-methoxy-6-polyprenyl-1,4-benzoquinol methylase UbiE [bacterium]